MRDWAVDYILHVLDSKDWSMNRLATEAGVAASTINRPLREKDWPNRLSRETLRKIQRASGIDPTPFIPQEMAEDRSIFATVAPKTTAARVLERLDQPAPEPQQPELNTIKIAIVGQTAQIVATVDAEGLAQLRRKLDALALLIDQQ